MLKENRREVIEFTIKLLGILIGFLLYSYSGNKSDLLQGKFDPTASAVSMGIVIYSWAEFWGNLKGKERTDTLLRTQTDIIRDINGKFDLQTYYSIEGWSEPLFSSMRQARRIHNVCVSTVNPTSLNDYMSVIGEAWVKEMKNALTRGCEWQDIMTKDMLRWRSEIANSARDKYKYKCFVNNEHLPIINFIILETTEGKREVYFGFGLHREADGYTVFNSKEKLVVELFWEWFRGMRASVAERNKQEQGAAVDAN